jgi:hypothetical protein
LIWVLKSNTAIILASPREWIRREQAWWSLAPLLFASLLLPDSDISG